MPLVKYNNAIKTATLFAFVFSFNASTVVDVFKNVQQLCNVTCFPTKSEHLPILHRAKLNIVSLPDNVSLSLVILAVHCYALTTKTLSDQDLFLFRFHYGNAFTALLYRVVFIRDREVRVADFVLWTRWFDKCKCCTYVSLLETNKNSKINNSLYLRSCTVFLFFFHWDKWLRKFVVYLYLAKSN